jgi:hypothetical protein
MQEIAVIGLRAELRRSTLKLHAAPVFRLKVGRPTAELLKETHEEESFRGLVSVHVYLESIMEVAIFHDCLQ